MGYRYDLHCHTIEGSRCSHLTAAEMVAFYQKQGYAGFCVTDHFTGSTTVPEGTPWPERIDRYFESYEAAVKAAEGTGLTVFQGLEYSILRYGTSHMQTNANITGNDFLLFGLTREWLKANEDAFNHGTNHLFDSIHAAGGFIVHAHPFGEGDWTLNIQLFPFRVDAVEVRNGGCSPEVNGRANWFAESYGLLKTAGTDLHTTDRPFINGVETPEKCETIQDLIAAIRAGKAEIFTTEVIH